MSLCGLQGGEIDQLVRVRGEGAKKTQHTAEQTATAVRSPRGRTHPLYSFSCPPWGISNSFSSAAQYNLCRKEGVAAINGAVSRGVRRQRGRRAVAGGGGGGSLSRLWRGADEPQVAAAVPAAGERLTRRRGGGGGG